jgi:CMP-N-acetylneuraminic acid synthetase
MILGITPARGGSKGIPRKNIKPIAGLPLIAWTIEAAKRSKMIDRYIISTEDDEIDAVAKQWGAEVLKRPLELAQDDVTTVAVLQHALSIVECSAVILLQATSPVREDGLIDYCIKQFLDNDHDSLATGYYCKCLEYGENTKRRQDIEGFFYDDGNVYVIKADLIRSGDRYGKKIGRVIPSRQESVEIDDDFDFWIAEHILREGL